MSAPTPCPVCGAPVINQRGGRVRVYCSRACQVARLREVKNTSFRLPDDLYDELHQAAAARGLSMNVLVTAALRDYLPRLIPIEEWSLTR